MQVLLVAGIGAKFLYDRANYPRLWVETAPYDPDMPIRGRYVNIALLVDADRAAPGDGDRAPNMFLARLEARGDRLVAVQDDDNGRHWVSSGAAASGTAGSSPSRSRTSSRSMATTPRASRRAALWAEVTLPPTGAPRPVRLGVKRGDAIEPIAP